MLGIPGKYATRYQAGANLVLLSPDVAEYFPNERSVNTGLRKLVHLAKGKRDDQIIRRCGSWPTHRRRLPLVRYSGTKSAKAWGEGLLAVAMTVGYVVNDKIIILRVTTKGTLPRNTSAAVRRATHSVAPFLVGKLGPQLPRNVNLLPAERRYQGETENIAGVKREVGSDYRRE